MSPKIGRVRSTKIRLTATVMQGEEIRNYYVTVEKFWTFDRWIPEQAYVSYIGTQFESMVIIGTN